MVRKKFRFIFFDTFVDVLELTVEQYFRLFSEDPKIYFDIFGKKIFEMNDRQVKNALEILISGEQKNFFKNSKKSASTNISFGDFFIFEGKIMHYLHQQRSEIRTWGISYFFKVLENLDVIIGEKSFDDYKNFGSPDKKGIKEILQNNN